MQSSFNHLNHKGDVHMVDISAKPLTQRQATAYAFVKLNAQTLELLQTESTQKGNVLNTARVAAIMAAKKTSELIPLCHPVQLSHVQIDISLTHNGITIEATCQTHHGTGVEMEAITAASHCALCIYDMCKVHQKDICIQDIKLLKKVGGKSGNWLNTSISS